MSRPKKDPPNHGKLYEVKVTVGHKLNGDPLRKSFYSPSGKDDARELAKQWMIEKAVSERTGEAFIEKEYTFSQWAKKWLETYKKPNVDIKTYSISYEANVNNRLIPYFGKADMESIKPVDIEEFFNKNSMLSESVLKKLHMCLNGIFETAIENDVCRKNPVKRIKIISLKEKNVKNVYSDEQIKKAKNFAKLKMPEVFVLLNTGVRRGELLGLQWDDFSKDEKTISVNRALADLPKRKPKNGKPVIEPRANDKIVAPGIKENPPKWKSYRTIPIDEECVAFIDSLPKNDKYIFPKADGNPQSPNTWSQKLKRFMVAMNTEDPDVPILSAHELRHTFGTMMHRQGVDIFTIQKIMGHKDIKMTTEIYVHDEVETLRKDMKLDQKSGTDVVQVSYGKKYHIKRHIKKAASTAE